MSVLIDSHGWVEFFAGGPLAEKYARYVDGANTAEYLTPSVVVYEVYKRVKMLMGEGLALKAISFITTHTTIIDADKKIALNAAEISIRHKLAMADAIIKATAEDRGAKIITGDPHFKGFPDVVFIS